MNNVILCGRFTRDHDLRYSQASEPMAILSNSLAVGRKYKKDETDFINVKAFGKTAENINKFFSKGRLILIRGHIQTGSYENKEGRKIYTTDVIIDDFEFTGEKKQEETTVNEQPANYSSYANYVEGIEDDDSLPF